MQNVGSPHLWVDEAGRSVISIDGTLFGRTAQPSISRAHPPEKRSVRKRFAGFARRFALAFSYESGFQERRDVPLFPSALRLVRVHQIPLSAAQKPKFVHHTEVDGAYSCDLRPLQTRAYSNRSASMSTRPSNITLRIACERYSAARVSSW